MLFSNIELLWYEFRIRNYKNMAKKNVLAGNKMTSQMNVATDNVTLQIFYAKVSQIFG